MALNYNKWKQEKAQQEADILQEITQKLDERLARWGSIKELVSDIEGGYEMAMKVIKSYQEAGWNAWMGTQEAGGNSHDHHTVNCIFIQDPEMESDV